MNAGVGQRSPRNVQKLARPDFCTRCDGGMHEAATRASAKRAAVGDPSDARRGYSPVSLSMTKALVELLKSLFTTEELYREFDEWLQDR